MLEPPEKYQERRDLLMLRIGVQMGRKEDALDLVGIGAKEAYIAPQ